VTASARRILLLGRSGQLGWELQRSLAPLGELVACGTSAAGDLRVDFGEPQTLGPLVRRLRPDVIVNAAAYTAVDKAESDPGRAQALNADAPGALARAAAEVGALLVHYSTDYVFDGSGSAPRDEDAPCAPLSVYGRTKLEGEQQVRAGGCRHLILRTSWVYAARGSNFARTVLRLAAEREQLRVVDDQVGAPTGAELLADVTAHRMLRTLAEPALGGTYHCVAGGETSWFGFARHVVERARARGRPLKLPPDGLLAIPTVEYPLPAPRPLNSRLSTERLRRTFGLVLPHWSTGADRTLDEILDS
jgi:dTDP-4-dehydrorhamnose reductase